MFVNPSKNIDNIRQFAAKFQHSIIHSKFGFTNEQYQPFFTRLKEAVDYVDSLNAQYHGSDTTLQNHLQFLKKGVVEPNRLLRTEAASKTQSDDDGQSHNEALDMEVHRLVGLLTGLGGNMRVLCQKIERMVNKTTPPSVS